jgi:hypothetical protein
VAEGIQYDVFATLKVAGGASFVNDMGRAAGSVDALQGAFDKLHGGAERAWGGLQTLGGMAAGVLGKFVAVGSAAVTAAAVGSAAAMAATGQNLAMLEGKSIQLASVIAAATERSFASVQGETGALFAQFKMDAVQSAGGMADFVDTASKIVAPIVGAGRSMEELRQITKGVIATAPALGVEFQQAGSDVMRMLRGSAGAELPFFQALKSIPSLGIESAEAFNKLSPEKRIDTLKKALTNPAFLAASDAAGESFKGLWATAEDLMMNMGGLAMSPAFGVLKRNLGGITKTLIEGLGEGGPVKGALEKLGATAGYRFGQITSEIGKLFPDLNGSIESTVLWVDHLVDNGLARVVSATSWVVSHWPEITSGAKAFAGWVSESADRAIDLVRTLGGGDLAKGIERAALLYGGAKVAAPTAQIALGTAQMVQGTAMVGKWAMGLFSSGTAAAGAAEAAAGSAGAAAAGASGSSAAAAAGGTLGGAGALAGGALAAGFAGFLATTYLAIEQDTFGFVRFLSDEWDKLMVAGERLWSSVQGVGRQFEALWEAGLKLYEAMKPLLGLFASLYAIPLAVAFEVIVTGATLAADGLTWLAQTLQLFAGYATEAIGPLTKLMDEIVDKLGLKKKTLAPVDEDLMRAFDAGGMGAPIITTSGTMAGGSSLPKKPPSTSGKQQVEVTLKWDLGEGNEEAIYVRTRRDLTEALQNARSFVRSGPLPGRF